MLHSRNSGRASGMSANMATNIEMPAYVRMAPTAAMPRSTRYGLLLPTLFMTAWAMALAAPDLSMNSPMMAPPMKMSRLPRMNPARPVTYEVSVPTMAFMMSMPLVSAMTMAVTMDVMSTFHPFMAATTKNTSPTTMPMTPIHSMCFPFQANECRRLSPNMRSRPLLRFRNLRQAPWRQGPRHALEANPSSGAAGRTAPT